MIIEQLDSLALMFQSADELSHHYKTFIADSTSSFSSQNKKFKDRKCVLQKQSSIANTRAEDLLHQIIYFFEVSALTSYSSSIKQTIKEALPIIVPPKKICFFKQASAHLQYLIVDTKLSNAQKISTLENLIVKINNTTLLDEQKLIASDLVNSVIRCLRLSIDINNIAVLQDTSCANTTQVSDSHSKYRYHLQNKSNNSMLAIQLVLYPISIDLLFIEEEKRFKPPSRNRNRLIDLGIHALDNEYMYMERCYRAFLYLLNLQKQTKKAPISFVDLINANAISGAYSAYPKTRYTCNVQNDMGHSFFQLIKNGLIENKDLSASRKSLSVSERMEDLQQLLQDKLDIKIKLRQLEFNGKIYFAVDTPVKTFTESGLNRPQQRLLDDLQGKTDDKAFVFTITTREDKFRDTHPIIVDISYCYYQDKASVCQQLLDIYYKKILDLPENKIKKINLSVELCAIMHRIHPFCDANGRTLFFILLPILLYQMNIWLTRMICSPWKLLDFADPRKITEKILPLCITAPEFTDQVNWYDHISVAEDIRISIALGDLTRIQKLITKHPSLLSQPIVVSPATNTLSLVECSVKHNQLAVLKFLLECLPKETLDTPQLMTMLYFCDKLQLYQIEKELVKYELQL